MRALATATALAVTLVTAAPSMAAKPTPIDPATYQGKKPAEASAALIELARTHAGKGSWERIAVGRVLYLTGKKAAGQELFDSVLNDKKAKSSDRIRVARVYAEAKEWAKAKPLFDRIVIDEPEDEDWLAEIGAYYLVNGDRATAEKLFAQSFALEPEGFRNMLRAAAAYSGVAPNE